MARQLVAQRKGSTWISQCSWTQRMEMSSAAPQCLTASAPHGVSQPTVWIRCRSHLRRRCPQTWRCLGCSRSSISYSTGVWQLSPNPLVWFSDACSVSAVPCQRPNHLGTPSGGKFFCPSGEHLSVHTNDIWSESARSYDPAPVHHA